MLADAWATALMVLGPQAGVTLARSCDIPALFLIRDGDSVNSITTGNIEQYF